MQTLELTWADKLRLEGEVRGRAEGEALALRQIAAQIITARFGGVPSALEQRLGTMSIAELTALGVRAATVTGADDLLPLP